MTRLPRIFLVLALWCAAAFALAPDIYTYLLNKKDFQELEAIETIFGLLDKQRDIVYPDTTSLLQAIQADLKDFTDAYPYIATHIRSKIKLHSEQRYRYCNEDEGLDCPVKKIWMDSIDLEILKGGLRNSGRFVVVAPQAIQVAQSIQDIDYPDSVLFHEALRHRLMMSFGLCPGNLTSKDANLMALQLGQEDYKALKSLWTLTKQDERTFAVVDSIRFASKTCDLAEWRLAKQEVDALYDRHLHDPMSARIRKFYPFDSSLAIQWSGKDCGCTQVDVINGTIYGFFPYWSAAREPLRMDFGVLNRVAYYGLTFDITGTLKYPNQTEQASALNARKASLDFVREAHQYNSRVDWVVEKTDWGSGWTDQSEEARMVVFRRLCSQITSLITEPLDDAIVRLSSKVSYAPEDPRTRGDGVNLYFRNYPTDTLSTRLFEAFFRELKDSLELRGDRYYVNFMVTRADMSRNEGIYSYKTFRRLLENDGLPADLAVSANNALYDQIRSYLLLFLEEPTSLSKQALRFEIDHALQGLDHKILLRSLIPVLTFDYKSWGQLREDIAYFNDAFFGIGLWPVKATTETVTSKTCEEGANLPNCLRQDFFYDGWENATPDAINRFVCAHRWGLRLAFFLAWIFLLILVLLVVFVCPVRHRLAKNPLIFLALCVVPPCSLFTLLLFFDPVLAKLRAGNLPFIIMMLLLLIGGGVVVAVLRYKKEKPVRGGK